MDCIHELKEKEFQEKKRKRIKSSNIWRLFYIVDDAFGRFAKKTVKKNHEKNWAVAGMFFNLMDITTTHTFLHYDLGYEGNPFVSRFYDAGILVEFEIMKILVIGFALAFNYISSTRGWTSEERNGGRMGLFIIFSLFFGVTVWNCGMMLFGLLN